MSDDQKPKKESRTRCRKCGGPLRVVATHHKGPFLMIRYRSCLKCKAKHRGVERIELDEPAQDQ